MRRQFRLRYSLWIVAALVGSFGVTSPALSEAPSATVDRAESSQTKLEKLVAHLKAGDPVDRAIAAQKICDLGEAGKSALPAVINLLDDESQVRTGNGSTQLRNLVIRMLTDDCPAAVDALIEALGHENPKCRAAAADILGRAKVVRAIGPLVEVLHGNNREMAASASWALCVIGEPAVPSLLEALNSENADVRTMAGSALCNMRKVEFVKPIALLLYDSDKDVRLFASRGLEELSRDRRPQFWQINQQREKLTPEEETQRAKDAALRQRVLEELKPALASENGDVRLAAAECAKRLTAAELRELLVECLKSDDCGLRKSATEGLAGYDDLRVVAPLLSALRDDDIQVRIAAAAGLVNLLNRYHSENADRYAALVDPLIAALDDDNSTVRTHACRGLTMLWRHNHRSDAVIDRIVKLLDDTDETVPLVAIESLEQIHDSRAIEPLAAHLEQPKLRMSAAVALVQLGDRRSIPQLRAIIAQTNNTAAIEALGMAKDRESVDALIKMLDNTEEAFQYSAARALSAIHDFRAVEPLINHLLRNQQVNSSAAQALGEFKDPRAIEPLIKAAAAEQFNRWQWNSFESGSNGPANNPVADPLRNMGIQVIKPLAAALADPTDQVREVAAYVLYSLASYGSQFDREDLEPAIEPLAAALADRDFKVRSYAAIVLAQFGDQRAVDTLLDVIAADPWPETFGLNTAAANELSRFKSPRIIDQLLVLIEDQRASVRTAAAAALGQMHDVRAAEPILHLLDDPEGNDLGIVFMELSNLRAPSTAEPLLARLTAKEPAMRQGAAEVLGRLGDRRAIEPLAKLLDDAEFKVQASAAISLLELHDPRGAERLAKLLRDLSDENRQWLMDQLSPSWIKKQDLVASLTKAMDDSSIAVRRAAAAQLCQLKTETAVDALWAHRDDAENRQNILSHLASLHDQRVLPLLTEQLNDERASIRASAIWPLVNFGAAAIDPLIDRLNDSASEVRLAAIRGLVELHAKAALPTLEKLLADASPDADPEIRAYAARAIKRIDRD